MTTALDAEIGGRDGGQLTAAAAAVTSSISVSGSPSSKRRVKWRMWKVGGGGGRHHGQRTGSIGFRLAQVADTFAGGGDDRRRTAILYGDGLSAAGN